MGGKGRGLRQDGSNRRYRPAPATPGLPQTGPWALLVWITTCFPECLPLSSPSIHRFSPLWLEIEV